MAILIDRWILTVVLTAISLTTGDAERPFTHLLAFYISSLEKCIFRSLAHFFLFVCFLLLLFCYWLIMSSSYTWKASCQLCSLQIFGFFLQVAFLLCCWFLLQYRSFLACYSSRLENPRDRGAWWAAIYGVAQSRTWPKWLSLAYGSIIYLFLNFCACALGVI